MFIRNHYIKSINLISILLVVVVGPPAAMDQGKVYRADLAVCIGFKIFDQVLFFKFSAEDAELKKAAGKMAVSMQRLSSARAAIADRVQPFIADFVKNIEI